SETEKSRQPPPGASSKYTLPLTILAFGITMVAIIMALVFAYHQLWNAPKNAAVETAQTIVNGIRNAFNFTPKVSIDKTIFVQESIPILELATVSRNSIIYYSYTNQWAGSTKILVLKGNFRVKGGFDLKQN